jgi:hypothetical protein
MIRADKSKRISLDQDKLTQLEEYEIPVFILSADDFHSIEALRQYLHRCTVLGFSEEYIDYVKDKLKKFEKWQSKFLAKVKQ